MERSGTLFTMMGTPLEHCNFSSHSFFPCSATLRATIIGTALEHFAERNAFDNDGTPLEHCNFSSHSLFPRSPPLRATIIGTALEHFPLRSGAERFLQ